MAMHTELSGRLSAVVLAVCVQLGGVLPGVARADAKTAPLACAASGMGSAARSAALCQGLGRELRRSVIVLEEGDQAHRAALHIVRGDVSWLVVWLEYGKARAFTKVSSADAAGREALFLARAARVLMREAQVAERGNKAAQACCLQVEPNGGVRMRSSDLAYPWADLKRCKVHVVDVLDPWWDVQADARGAVHE